jgi:four helix bundle protein
MATVKRFEDIQAWQKARTLVREIYQTCGKGSLRRDFGLKDQLCRSAVSAMSNVAEGFARKTDKDFAPFLDVAKGSAIETQSLLYVALDVGYVERDEFGRLYRIAEEAASLIGGFTSYLRASSRLRTPD